ncbi:sigma-54 interaction domain-containing protein [Robertmurraya sp. P23]|uniref:sigma-54 interaction domain-containing protein n=1 Tax=Robertmurraya sp. P23 TaxID=3436931 RepID=UPI003D99DA03
MFQKMMESIEEIRTITNGHAPLGEIVKQLISSHVVVALNEAYFTILKDERKLLSIGNQDTHIKDWINEVEWTPSSVVVSSDLSVEKMNWQRPVVLKDTNNQLIGIITADKWIPFLEQECEKVKGYFHILSETINDAVTAVDKEGNVVCWNNTSELTYKIKKDKILGRKLKDHFDSESLVLNKILQEGRQVRGAYHRPNKVNHVLINAAPIIVNNQIEGGIAIERDITKIIRLNEELTSTLPVLVHQDHPYSSIVGVSKKIKEAVGMAQKVAHADIPVLLRGESGAGKEMLAQAIHYGGSKSTGPYVTINCSVIPPALLEIELFGFQNESFIEGSQTRQIGKIEQAYNGTLFIEDVDKMTLSLQEKLLDYLVKHSFYRVGGKEDVTVNTRIVASASQSLEDLVREGEFNEKLYYHLSVISIHIPPLRERTEDIAPLIKHYVNEFCTNYHKKIPQIDSKVLKMLVEYDWPGNVRELRNIVERFIILSDQSTITIEDVPENIIEVVEKKRLPLKEKKQQEMEGKKVEALQIESALRKTYGNKSAAATLLGISRGTLYNKIKEYGL